MDPDQQLRCFDTSDLSSSDDRAAEPGGLTSGRTYSMMNIGGNARVHNGDHYTFNQYLADDGPAAKRQKSEHARQQSETLRKELLDSVRFPEMFMRQESLRTNTIGTYEWVFTGEPPFTVGGKHATAEDHELRGRILAWLRNSESFFLIKGKPGSGKSKLMSFLLQDPRTKEELQHWASNRTVHVLSFSFWKAGSDLQKTIPGLLRSMIWQLVRFMPNSVDKMLAHDLSLPFSAWNDARLNDTVEQLLQIYQDDRILFLVDGLDECEDDLGELVGLLSRFGIRGHVKACFSSRPEVALTVHLGRVPRITLQDLNHNDILIHAQKVFKPYGESLETLCADVALHAQGVFLWAILVCKALIRGHLERDDRETLYRRLTAFPRGLEGLFARMFSEIDQLHQQSLKLYLNSVDCLPGNTTLALLAATLHRHRVRNIEHFVEICNEEQIRIVSQSRGLIEVVDNPHTIDNFHIVKGWALKTISTGEISRHPADLSKPQMRKIYKRLSWVHRSAYEYIHGASRTENNFQMDAIYKNHRNRNLWQGVLWLVQFLPIVGLIKGRHDGLLKVHNYSSVGLELRFFDNCGKSQVFGREIDEGLHAIHAAIGSWMHNMVLGENSNDADLLACRDWTSPLLTKPLLEPMFWFWENVFRDRPKYLVHNADKLMRDPGTETMIIGLIARFLDIWNLGASREDTNDIDEQRSAAMQLITNDIDVGAHEYQLTNRPNLQLADNVGVARPKLYTWCSSTSNSLYAETFVMDSVSALNDLWQQGCAGLGMLASCEDTAPGFRRFTTIRRTLARIFDLLDAWLVFVSMSTYTVAQHQLSQSLDIQLPIRYSFSSLLSGWRHEDVNILNLVTAKPVLRICCMKWQRQRWYESSGWPTQANCALQVFDLSTTLSERLIKLLTLQRRAVDYDQTRGYSIDSLLWQDGGYDAKGAALFLLFAGPLTDLQTLAAMILDEIWEDRHSQLTAWGRLYCRACVRRWFRLFWVLEEKA